MPRRELYHTLVAAVEAISPRPGDGLVVTDVELDLPLELVVGSRAGTPVLTGTAPHSRWIAGVLPEVHLAHLRITLDDSRPAGTRRHGD